MEENKMMSLKNASPEELRKWQFGLLDILVYFRDFCKEHNLKFYLAGGTRLGAIRHQGFIPWDDDVDVQMFREDYDRLIELWDKEADTSRFVCQVSNKDRSSRFPMATVRSVNTTCIYDHSVNDDFCQGLKIDVEFLDVVPKGMINKILHTFIVEYWLYIELRGCQKEHRLLKPLVLHSFYPSVLQRNCSGKFQLGVKSRLKSIIHLQKTMW